jgi:LacI family transcriptional regulator
VFLEQRDLWSAIPPWLESWDGDGVISRLTTTELADLLDTSGIPVVDLTDRFGPTTRFAQVWSDNATIGRLAADHLLERGFRHLAACGFEGEHWSSERCGAFAGAVRDAGHACELFESPWLGREHDTARPWEESQRRLARWLDGLPRPLGVMACNDVRGQQVLDACVRAGLAAPEEVAVIGVDDDEIVCELCDPPLSSVRPNPTRIGYTAAELLAQMMGGEHVPAGIRRVPPVGVTTRQSTDTLAIDDAAIAVAVKYIREHACAGATVDDVLAQVPLSRSVLERRFRKILGRSPQAVIRQTQLKEVRRLLTDTDLTLDHIADLTGFKHTEHMVVVFKREHGETPGRYRRAQQARVAR